jgi:Ca2+-binding RTX toxin-like protein
MRWRSAGALVLLIGATALWPTPAHAAVTCNFNNGTNVLQINIGDNDTAYVDRQGQSIRVRDNNGAVSCSGGAATVNNTDDIDITGSAGNNTLYIILDGGRFSPGATNEPGSTDEVEINLNLLGGSDTIFIGGSPGGSGANMRAGMDGINLNAGETTGKDADLDTANDPYIQLVGSFGATNVISGAGGAGTGAPFPDQLDIRGYNKVDILTGGSDNDYLDGDEGRDVLRGSAGFDRHLGGPGRDTLTYKGASGVEVNLATDNTTDDGMGSTDLLLGIQNVIGSPDRDDIRGNDFANTIIGGEGRDQLFGRGHNDRLRGKKGNDELRGNEGDDDLEGGQGIRDLCRGGPGSDDLDSCEL